MLMPEAAISSRHIASWLTAAIIGHLAITPHG
jgi:hypothetical protein